MRLSDYQDFMSGGLDPNTQGMTQLASFQEDEEDPRLRPGYKKETSFMGDIVRGLGYGVQQAVGGIYELADTILADSLTDWQNTQASKIIEAPQTFAGGLASSVTQFVVPFFALGPVAGLAGRTLAASKLAGSTVPVASGAARGAAKGLQWLDAGSDVAGGAKLLAKAENAIKSGNTAAAATYTMLHGVGRGAVKGAIVDFAVTTKGEETLSTFLQSFPELQNPLFEALTVDEDDGVFMSKAKTMIEGLGLGIALDGVLIGLRAKRAHARALAAGATEEEAAIQATKAASDSAEVIRQQQRELEDIELRTVADRPVAEVADDGTVTFHASPHKFDEFSTDNMGGGEGVQAFGWGLYFTESESIGNTYLKRLSEGFKLTGDVPELDEIGNNIVNGATAAAKKGLINVDGDYNKSLVEAQVRMLRIKADSLESQFRPTSLDAAADKARIDAIRRVADGIENGTIKTERDGNLYKVKLKPKQDEYLLWDKPMSEQSDKVKKALQDLGLDEDATGKDIYLKLVELKSKELPDIDIEESPEVASKLLLSKGIRGIKYLDGLSRDAGGGGHNYVIFDGADTEILEGPNRGAPVPREGSPAPTSLTEETEGVLTEAGQPKTIKQAVEELLDEERLLVEVLDSLGISGRRDAEQYLEDVANLADDVAGARFAEEVTPRDPEELFGQAPRQMDRETLERNGMTEFSRNLRNIASTQDGFRYLVRFLEDVKAPEAFQSDNMADVLAQQMYTAKKIGTMNMADLRANIDDQLKRNVDLRDMAFKTGVLNVLSIKYGEVLSPYVGAIAQRGEVDLKTLQSVGNMVKGFMDLQNSVRGFHSELGRQLKQLHAFIDADKVMEEVSTEFTFKPLELIQGITEETFDADVARKLLSEMAEIMQSPDPLANALAAVEFMQQPRHKKALAVMQEYHINSILSGVATQTVNAVSGAFMTFWRPAEQLVGASLMRIQGEMFNNDELIQASKHLISEEKLTVKNLYSGFLETFQAVRQTGGSFAAAASKQEGQRFSPIKAMAAEADRNRKGDLFTHLARAITVPAGLVDKTDVFFKEWNGRAKARAVITRGLRDQGIPLAEIPERTEMLLKGILEHKGHLRSRAKLIKDIRAATHPAIEDNPIGSKGNILRDSSDAELDTMIEAQEKAILRGMEATFQTEIKPVTQADRIALNVQRTVQDAPLLKFFLPFIKTPYNIATYGWDRSFGAVFGGTVESTRTLGQKFGMQLPRTEESLSKISRMLSTGRPEELAQVRANLALGLGGVATMINLASESFTDENGFTLPVVTGSGPSDPDALKTMKAAGWQPYSWRIGDKYYSYQRLDPLATLLGIVVDVGEYYTEASDVERGEVFTMATTAMFTSMSQNILNKTYMTGLQNLLDAVTDENKAKTVLGATAGSFVPSIVANANKIIDPQLREIRSFVDRVRSRIPGMSADLPIKRDVLGEPIRQEAPVWEFFAPVRVTAIKDDKVREELAKFAYGFSQPATSRLGVDLLDPKFKSGDQLAYDRYLELTGKVRIRGLDLRQALRKEISDPSYQALDPFPSETGENSPRIDRIQSILRRYRATAWDELLRENSTLRSGVDEATRIRSRRRRGLSL